MDAVAKLQRAPTSRDNIKDQMAFANQKTVAVAGFRCLNAIQAETEAVQLLALAQMFLMYCRKYGVDPRDILGKAGALIEDGLAQNNEHVMATARFLKVHLKGETQAFF